jgi:RNA polymerase primary sigma factor
MTELQNDPAIKKLLEYAKDKTTLSYDELNDLLPEELVKPDKIDEVMVVLADNNIRMSEEVQAQNEDLEKDPPHDHSGRHPKAEEKPEAKAEKAKNRKKAKRKKRSCITTKIAPSTIPSDCICAKSGRRIFSPPNRKSSYRKRWRTAKTSSRALSADPG